jgi:hypothetical protein
MLNGGGALFGGDNFIVHVARATGAERSGGFGPCGTKYGGTVVEGAAKYLAARLEDYELLSGDERKDGVGSCLGILDEIAIDIEPAAVQAREFDHEAYLSELSSAELGAAIDEVFLSLR